MHNIIWTRNERLVLINTPVCVSQRTMTQLNSLVQLLLFHLKADFLLFVHFCFVHNGNDSVCWILGFLTLTELNHKSMLLKMKLKHSTTPSFNFSSSDVLRSPTCVVTVRKVYKYSSYMKSILTKY